MEHPSWHTRVSETVQEMLRRADAPGAGVALLVDGKPVFEASIGFRNVALTQALPEDARFYIYSITKTMVAVAILQLVEQGRLELDLPVQSYPGELPIAQPVTLRQLLNHTSGLPDYGALPAYEDAVRTNPQQPWSRTEFLEHTLRGDLLFMPGEGWHYSNIGYLLLLMVLEQSSGRELHEVLQQQIFMPLGLKATFVAQSLASAQNLSPGYSTFLSENNALQDVRERYHPSWVAHGLVVSTAGELARFLRALFDGQLVGTRLLEEMYQPEIVGVSHRLFHQTAYGLGLMLDPQSPYGLVAGHGGGGPGYSTAAFFLSDIKGRSVISVALVNRDVPDLGLEIAFTLADLLAYHS